RALPRPAATRREAAPVVLPDTRRGRRGRDPARPRLAAVPAGSRRDRSELGPLQPPDALHARDDGPVPRGGGRTGEALLLERPAEPVPARRAAGAGGRDAARPRSRGRRPVGLPALRPRPGRVGPAARQRKVG